VCFASTDMGWCFTLRSFAKMYAETYGAFNLYLSPICCDPELRLGNLDVAGFADRLWGDIYFNDDTRKFTRKAADPESPRTFVRFVLEPLYRLYSQVLSEETDNLKDTLAELNIHLKPVLDQFFGPATGLIDMIVEWIPDPADSAATKVSFVSYQSILNLHEASSQVERTYTGPMSSDVAVSMRECRSDGPVSVHITKLYHATDAQSFRALGRVISGTLKKGEQVKVLGEGYSPEDEEDMMRATVDDLWVSGSRSVPNSANIPGTKPLQ
jgi:U5 small nuclear ribonucleoprotein component